MAADIDRVRAEALAKRRTRSAELACSRKRKLVELYTVSTLSCIRTTADDEGDVATNTTRSSAQQFADSHSMEDGVLFDPKKLPQLEFDDDSGVVDNEWSADAQSNEDDPVRPKTPVAEKQEVQLPKPPVQPQSSEPGEPQIHTDAKPQLEVQSMQSISNVENRTKKPAAAVSSTMDSSSSATSTKTGNITVPMLVPQQTIATDNGEIPKSSFKRQKTDEMVQLFNADNKDAFESLVVLLKDCLPAKVAEVTPLAELYYLAQTLPLVKLMPTTHKAVTTSMFETALTEGKINVVHSRIEELKRQGKWSLRQPTRFIDPMRNSKKTQWDNLLSEMNWMACDFREEKRLKIATCGLIAKSVADYWKFGKVCCIKTRPIKFMTSPSESDDDQEDINDEDATQPTSQIDEQDSIDISELLKRPDPSTEFTLVQPPEVELEDYMKYLEEEEPSPFKLQIDTNDVKYSDKTLLDGMPSFSSFQHFDDNYESAPLVPISKALIPREDQTWFKMYIEQKEDQLPVVPDPQKGLFGFSFRNRLTSAIKPPQPPSLRYLNLRTPTIWLPEDDQNLIEYVNQFSFNWGAVSAHLSKRPTRSYQSNIERRTPWQCFERYIQLNDAFQIADMRGHNYMAATKWLEHAHHIQATTKRRISPLGVGVESIQRGHKRLRWASMFEAIRKCMRKRENVTKPNQNHQRKNIDENKLAAPTPAELSKLKFERDKAIQDAYVPRGRAPATAVGALPADSKAGPAGANASRSVPKQANPAQPNSQMQSRPNSRPNSVPAPTGAVVPKNGNGPTANPAIAAQLAAGQMKTGPNGTAYTPEQIQQLMQIRQRKLAANGQGSPSPNAGNAQLTNALGSSRSNSNPVPMVPANASPLVQQARATQQTFVPAQVSAVINQIQTQHPNLSKEEVTRMAAQYLANLQNKQNRAAAAAAAAASTATASGGVSNASIVSTNGSNIGSPAGSQRPSPVIQGKPLAVPTPQQILQQQNAMVGASPIPNGSTPVNAVSAANLTPEQKAQLDMLKVLHAEQQQKRQQASSQGSQGSSS